jgi:hypothetical protein
LLFNKKNCQCFLEYEPTSIMNPSAAADVETRVDSSKKHIITTAM